MKYHMYEKFYFFVAGSSLLSERDMKPFLPLDEMKYAVYGHFYICLFHLSYCIMDRPLSREEKRKNKKKERKRQQRRLIAVNHQKLVESVEMDNKEGNNEDNEIEKKREVIIKEETKCSECDSRDIQYRCDNCKKVFCAKVEELAILLYSVMNGFTENCRSQGMNFMWMWLICWKDSTISKKRSLQSIE